jgi:hypothetical protein
MRRSAIGTTRQLAMQIDGAQGTCCNRGLQSWSGLDVDLPSLTVYDANRTPSSVPTGIQRSDLWATLSLGAS